METNQYTKYGIPIVVFLLIIVIGMAVISKIGDTSISPTTVTSNESFLILNGINHDLSKVSDVSFSATTKNNSWLDFNGVNTRVNMNDSQFNYNNSNGFSISFWFKKPETVDPVPGYIVCKSLTTGGQRTFQFHTNTGNDVLFIVSHNGSNTNITTSQINNFVAINTWYHVVGEWNRTATRLFLNGVLIDSDTGLSGSTNVYSGTANLTIGNCDTNLGYFNGSVNDLRVYNTTLTRVEVNDIYLQGLDTGFVGGFKGGYYDDFSSYALGFDTTPPVWLPQYAGFASIESVDGNQKFRLNYTSSTSSDRDLHATLNISKISNGIQNLSITYNFNTTACNVTYKDTEGVSNIASSGYLYYLDGNNFLSYEIKTNASNATCGTGNQGQFALYKRVAGTTSNLNPQSFFTFNMSQVYNVTISFTTFNASNFNYSVSLDGIIQRSNNSVGLWDVSPGSFLIETAGTSTLYDDINITRAGLVTLPTYYIKLDESQDSVIYDRIKLLANGTLGLATWNSDGIKNTMTNNIDYSVSTSVFTLINSNFTFRQISTIETNTSTSNDVAPVSNDIVSSVTDGLDLIPTLIIGSLVGIILLMLLPLRKDSGGYNGVGGQNY